VDNPEEEDLSRLTELRRMWRDRSLTIQTTVILWVAAVAFFAGGIATWGVICVVAAVIGSVSLARRWRQPDA